MKVLRSDEFRYGVDTANADLTPLASVKAYVGTLEVRVHNISQGGMAIIFDREPQMVKGDIIDLSVEIRERAFPVQVEIKDKRGLRFSCAFRDPPRSFTAALRDFLKPKFLGQSLEKNVVLSGREDVLKLVPAATSYEVYLGQNQSGVFVWTGEQRVLLKLVAVGQDLVLEWTQENGLRSGRLMADVQTGAQVDNVNRTDQAIDEDGIQWHRNPEASIVHYFTDIFLAWLPENHDFVESLISESHISESHVSQKASPQLIFPEFKDRRKSSPLT